jgi:hypothetical protein
MIIHFKGRYSLANPYFLNSFLKLRILEIDQSYTLSNFSAIWFNQQTFFIVQNSQLNFFKKFICTSEYE